MTDTTTPEQEVKTAPETTVNNEPAVDTVAEPTVADLHKEESAPVAPEKKRVDSVPIARLNKGNPAPQGREAEQGITR